MKWRYCSPSTDQVSPTRPTRSEARCEHLTHRRGQRSMSTDGQFWVSVNTGTRRPSTGSGAPTVTIGSRCATGPTCGPGSGIESAGQAPKLGRAVSRGAGLRMRRARSRPFESADSRPIRGPSARHAVYVAYMAPRAQYVRPSRLSSGSRGSGGSGKPVSPLFSTTGRSPNPTLSAINNSFQVNNLQSANG